MTNDKPSNKDASNSLDKLDNFIYLAKVSDFEEGKGKKFVLNNKEIAIFKYKGQLGAISSVCSHQDGPLADGNIENGYVVCPWHQYEFDPFTGDAPPGYDDGVDAYDIKINGDDVYVSLIPKDKNLLSENRHSNEYLEDWARYKDDLEPNYAKIQSLAKGSTSETTPMGTKKPFPNWSYILFKGAQLYRMPLNADEAVNTKTVIGKSSKYPLILDIPFYVSHMSYGALSKEAKIAMAKGSSLVGTMICSGEGGMLPEEQENANIYVYELGTAPFSYNENAIIKANAIEIKIGQAAKPGMGGHLSKEKITDDIALIRGIPKNSDFIAPGRHKGINCLDDLKHKMDNLRKLTPKPIGIKFSAGHIEKDLERVLSLNPDFITIDCRGGGTGSAPNYIKDNVCLPPIFAISRARRYMDDIGSKVSLCVTGGFRDSSDIAKALALGADAIALATASMISIGCQQYRICHTGRCPVGIATQDNELRKRFSIEESTKRFVNFYNATKEELKNIARINGKNDVHLLNKTDIFTLSNEISQHCDIEHA